MATKGIAGIEEYVIQETIGTYADEAYTTEKGLSGTALVSPNPDINPDVESFIGQARWFQPLDPQINVASLTDATDGTTTDFTADFFKYIKTVRTHGATKKNMTEVVTKVDGLAKIGRDFAKTKRLDMDQAILSVVKGVGLSEALRGAAGGGAAIGLGGRCFENDPTDPAYGFYVDLGASKAVIAASTTAQGAARAEGFLEAFGMAYKDYEPDYAYLVTSPEMMASFRSANLVDQDRVTEGSVDFSTIFNGKFRLILTRSSQSFTTTELSAINAGAGVDIVGTKCSYIILPGALALQPLTVPMDVEITRDGSKYKGGGISTIWYRWGYVAHPAGYDWAGAEDDFVSNNGYRSVKDVDGGIHLITDTLAAEANLTNNITAASATAYVKSVFQRKQSSVLTCGILPIFHS